MSLGPLALPQDWTLSVRVQPWRLDGRPQAVLSWIGGKGLSLYATSAGAELRVDTLRPEIARGRHQDLADALGVEVGPPLEHQRDRTADLGSGKRRAGDHLVGPLRRRQDMDAVTLPTWQPLGKTEQHHGARARRQ